MQKNKWRSKFYIVRAGEMLELMVEQVEKSKNFQ